MEGKGREGDRRPWKLLSRTCKVEKVSEAIVAAVERCAGVENFAEIVLLGGR